MLDLVIGGTYQHFKGHKVAVLCVATHTETGEELVIYEHLYDPDQENEGKIRARPKAMFLQEITRDGQTFPRFRLLT
jgi:hypothetical protein